MHRTRWLAIAVICLFAAIAIAGLRVQSSKTSLAGSASQASSGISDSWLLSDRARPRYLPDLAPFVQPGELQPAVWAVRPTLKEGAVADAPYVEARAAVVLDEASARVLYQKDADRRLPPASLTKIVTAILALQVLDPAQLITVDVDSRTMKGSSVMGLLPGDTLTANELLLGLMLPSGNDAALALGRAIAGSDSAFVERMNELVRELGLGNTRFRNPHGLNAPGHYSSAYDLAMLARYAMSNPNFAALVATPAAVVTGRKIELRNGNSFLRDYAGADGVKIGFTNQAGNTLVASASRNGHRLYVVVLNTTQRDADAAALMDWAFANYSWPGE